MSMKQQFLSLCWSYNNYIFYLLTDLLAGPQLRHEASMQVHRLKPFISSYIFFLNNPMDKSIG